MSKRYGKRFKPSKWLKARAEQGISFHGPAGESKAA
jgi:hypothetical protein